MKLDEFEASPKNRTWNEAPPVSDEFIELPSCVFWMVGDDGVSRRMTWTEDGRIVPVDEYGWGD